MVSTDCASFSHSSDWNHHELETIHGNILGSLIYIQCVCVRSCSCGGCIYVHAYEGQRSTVSIVPRVPCFCESRPLTNPGK